MNIKIACAIVIGSLSLGLLSTTGAEARPHFGDDDPGARSAPVRQADINIACCFE
ncbi:MAG: hypothetical protein K0U34_01310 [Alphaproteobacteria bacterium]|nr:hypothetical protein [Alphaproteobacteria bacterium]